MHSYDLMDNNSGKVLGRVKIKKTLKQYAEGAISTISEQLLTVKSPRRKLRLESRLSEWKRVLELVEAEQAQNVKLAEELIGQQQKEMIVDVEDIQAKPTTAE